MTKTPGLTAVLVLLMCPVAMAQRDGIHYDPDSPAGKEYALPLEQARDASSGDSDDASDSGGRAALFGSGISARAGGRRADGDSGRGSGGEATGRGSADRSESETRDRRERTSVPAVTSTATAGQGLDFLTTLGVVCAVFAIGSLLVGALRRRRSA